MLTLLPSMVPRLVTCGSELTINIGMRMHEILRADEAAAKPKNPNVVTLYRGDASSIDAFDINRTDLFALFGRGIYLTNSKRIANDYKTKGPSEAGDVLFRTSGKKREDVIKSYVRKLARCFDAEGNDHSNDMICRFGSGVPYSDGGNFGVITNDLRRLEHEKREGYAMQKVQELLKTYEVRIKTDGTAVIQKKATESVAKLSVFEVPVETVRRTIDAEASIGDDVLNVLAYWLQKHDDGDTARDMLNHVKQYRREEGENPSYREIFTSITGDSPLLHREEAQKSFSDSLLDLGYNGISYAGGLSMGGGHTHRAYVFWDVDAINACRVK